MKVGKHLLHRVVVVQWLDPQSRDMESHKLDGSDIPRGEDGLALRREKGTIEDITPSQVGPVIRINHWEAPRRLDDDINMTYNTWLPEVLITDIELYVKEETTGKNGAND